MGCSTLLIISTGCGPGRRNGWSRGARSWCGCSARLASRNSPWCESWTSGARSIRPWVSTANPLESSGRKSRPPRALESLPAIAAAAHAGGSELGAAGVGRAGWPMRSRTRSGRRGHRTSRPWIWRASLGPNRSRRSRNGSSVKRLQRVRMWWQKDRGMLQVRSELADLLGSRVRSDDHRMAERMRRGSPCPTRWSRVCAPTPASNPSCRRRDPRRGRETHHGAVTQDRTCRPPRATVTAASPTARSTTASRSTTFDRRAAVGVMIRRTWRPRACLRAIIRS